MPAGRPSTYSDEVIDKAIHYLENYEQLGDRVPIAAGLCDEIGISKTTLYRWAQEHPEFRDMLDAINAKQERKLCNGGLGGDYSAVITKLMLAKHGYSDKQELSGPDGGPIVTEELNMVEAARKIAFILNAGVNTKGED